MFDLSSSQHTFDSFTFHGNKTSTGVSIEICANDFSNVDLIILEKYDSTHHIFNKVIDFTKQDLERSKSDTFYYLLPGKITAKSIADIYQIKFITKDHVIKIYNDINAQGIFFSNNAKRESLFAKHQNKLSALSLLQKQSLKKELKFEAQGYEVLKETNYIELVYNKELEQYFVLKHNQFLEEQREEILFVEELKKIQMLYVRNDENKSEETLPIETTWIELDNSFLNLFSRYN